MVKRQNVGNGFIEVLGLVQQRLTVKRGDVFIEIDREEIKRSLASKSGLFVVL